MVGTNLKKIALAVHGGAGTIPDDRFLKMVKAIRRILNTIYPELLNGCKAIDVVERAVVLLENDELFNAGYGSTLRSDGSVRMDACIMNGETLAFGAVGAVSRLRNPIELARIVMEKMGSGFLVGDGAEAFAEDQGMKLVSNKELVCPWRAEQWEKRAKENVKSPDDYDNHGTVGAVALDCDRNLASATSTGGIFYAPPFRVGDTPIIGAGTYADVNCAVSATGIGETIMKACLAKSCADLIANGIDATKASQLAISIFGARTAGKGGLIALDKLGNVGFSFNSWKMPFGYWTREEGVVVPCDAT